MTTTEQHETEAPETGPFVCPPDHPHDKFNTCYRTHRCRCRPCTTREARRKAKERARRREGRHEGMVDKTWVVGHIQALELMGMTHRDIARCAGLNEATVHRLAADKGERVFPQTAKAIFAVRPESKAWRKDQAWVNSVGTIRRIQALMAIGYSGSDISLAIGHAEGWAALTLRTNRPRIEEQSRRAMTALYEQWAMTPRTGHYPNRTRRLAASRGYLPPLAWDDDIDDPAARPVPETDPEPVVDNVAVARALAGHETTLNRPERVEAVRIAHSRKWSDMLIASRIGVDGKTVANYRSELGLPAWSLDESISRTEAA